MADIQEPVMALKLPDGRVMGGGGLDYTFTPTPYSFPYVGFNNYINLLDILYEEILEVSYKNSSGTSSLPSGTSNNGQNDPPPADRYGTRVHVLWELEGVYSLGIRVVVGTYTLHWQVWMWTNANNGWRLLGFFSVNYNNTSSQAFGITSIFDAYNNMPSIIRLGVARFVRSNGQIYPVTGVVDVFTNSGWSETNITGTRTYWGWSSQTSNTSYSDYEQLERMFPGAEWTLDNPLGPVESGDIFDQGGNSTGGGGGGSWDNTSDPVSIPGLPTISAVDAGLITLFNPSISELKGFAGFLWSDSFSIDSLKKLFGDPMESVLGLSIVPVQIPSGGQKEVYFGNILTNIYMNAAASQYVAVDCGSINVEEYWGAYLDYDPFTKFEIFLPYIGVQSLSADDVVGKTLKVVYHIDILSGACVAYLQCGESVLYTFAGQCATNIPITSSSWSNLYSGILSIAGTAAAIAVTKNPTAGAIVAGISSVASAAVNNLHIDVARSGGMSSAAGLLGNQTPYLIITRPRQCVPVGQNSFIGYPSYQNVVLSTQKGYTEVDSIHLNGVSATSGELAEIEALLTSGVII